MKRTQGWLAQWGGGMWRGIWLVRVGYTSSSCLLAITPPVQFPSSPLTGDTQAARLRPRERKPERLRARERKPARLRPRESKLARLDARERGGASRRAVSCIGWENVIEENYAVMRYGGAASGIPSACAFFEPRVGLIEHCLHVYCPPPLALVTLTNGGLVGLVEHTSQHVRSQNTPGNVEATVRFGTRQAGEPHSDMCRI